MGRASRWFRRLLGLKKPDSSSPSPVQPPPPSHCREKRRWSFVKSHRDRDGQSRRSSCREPETVGVDREGHAMAVAAANAAAAEAAVAAAQAAAAVMRLTSSGKCSPPCLGGAGGREEWAALKIQSAFRGYLARRALRALKGLVKIQALVRGHIERKKTTVELQQMQAVLRVQARARSKISETSQSSSKSSHFNHPGPKTPEKSEQSSLVKCSRQDQSPNFRRNGSKSCGRTISYQHGAHFGRNKSERCTGEGQWNLQRGSLAINYPPDEEHGDKILEVDTVRPLYTPKGKKFVPSMTAHYQVELNPSLSSGEMQSLRPLKFTQEMEETPFCTADNSPQFQSASSRGSSQRNPFTASDGSGSFFSRYSNHPNYMAYTKSSRAKVRSLSAPKQRPQFEKLGSNGFGESRSASQVPSSLQSSFASKAYPGSGRLDRLGMPVARCGVGSGYRYYN